MNDLISLRNQQLEQLDLLIKSCFVEMFGNPKVNNKNWKTGNVGDYYYIKGGKRIPKGMNYSSFPTSHPYLRGTDMKDATIIEDDIHYISDEVYNYIKNYTVNTGDVYLTNVGVNLGMAGIIPPKFDKANLTENAVKFVAKTEEKLNRLFLVYYINTPGVQEYINERKMAVGVPKLAIFRIETMPLIFPPLALQNQFAAFVEEVEKEKDTVKQSLEQLDILKKKLMQEYFG